MSKIHVESRNDWLRLRWSHQGQRYELPLKLLDNVLNRKVADRKAADIDFDLSTGNFDSSLAKYRPEHRKPSGITVAGLFEQFRAERARELDRASLIKYDALLIQLKEFFKNTTCPKLTTADCDAFRDWLKSRTQNGKLMAPITLKQKVSLLSSCWNWAIETKVLDSNPWIVTVRAVKVGKMQPAKPFTAEEIRLIFQSFRSDRHYSHYADYVEFLMGTGARPGEVIALKWKHVSRDGSSVWFGESHDSGETKERTKNYKSGHVPMSASLQKLLLRRRPESPDLEALIFPAPGGGHIDPRNFRNRAWKKILEKASIEYRKPRSTRSTLISHWLAMGEDPAVVAKMTRTSVKTIYEHYSGSIKSRIKLPDLELPNLEG